MVTRKETGFRGGTMLPQAASYQELTAKFRWQVHEHYNIGVDACDRWAQAKEGHGLLALIHLAEDGRETRSSFGDMKRLSNRCANVLEAPGGEDGDRGALPLGRACGRGRVCTQV